MVVTMVVTMDNGDEGGDETIVVVMPMMTMVVKTK